MTRIPRNTALLVVLAALAACNQPTAPAGAMEAGNTAEQAALKGTHGMLSVTPGRLTCAGAVAEVAWNASSNPAVKMVEVRIGDGADAKLFTTQMPMGSAETGPWVTSGMLLVLRNAADGSELDRVTVQGPPCAARTAAPAATAPSPANAPPSAH